MDPGVTVAGGVVILLLIGVSAFFSSSELAIFSLPSHRIDSLKAGGTASGIALGELREDPHRLLVTVLVGNNVANIAAASVVTAILIQLLPPGEAVTGATIFTSIFVLVLGEIAPKSYAVSHAEPWALRVARPLSVAQRLMTPVVYVFEVATNAVNRLLGGSSEFESYLTREEIETIVVSGEETGVLDRDEGTMIRAVLELEALTVRSVMVPRVDMTAVPDTSTLEEVIDVCVGERVTRIPVYGENRDEIHGIVDLRDAIAAHTRDRTLESVIEEPRFVPESKPLDELLAEMQSEAIRMVIVVDEFGSVVGIATLDDVIEEVVGEIFDRGEHDPIRIIDEDTAVASGWTTVAYVNESLGVSLPDTGDVETIAGLIHSNTGSIPGEGDRIEIGGLALTVLDATNTRIRRVRIDYPGDDGNGDGDG